MFQSRRQGISVARAYDSHPVQCRDGGYGEIHRLASRHKPHR